MSKRPPSPPISCPPAKAMKKNVKYTEIQHASNRCWTGLLVCQKCKQVPSSYSFSEEKPWLMSLHYDKCKQSFNVCTLCRSNKYQLFNDVDIKKHRKLMSHKKNVSKYQNQIESYKELENTTFGFNNTLDFTSSNETNSEEEFLSQHLSNPNMKYFLMEYHGLGNAYLFASSFFPLHGDIYNQISNFDAEFSLSLGSFVFELKRSQREQFSNILSGLQNYMLSDSPKNASTTSDFPLRLPLSTQSLRSTFFETKICLRKQLPIPDVTIVKTENSKYSFTSLLECLTHFLAFGQGTEDICLNSFEEFKGNMPITSTKNSRYTNKMKKRH